MRRTAMRFLREVNDFGDVREIVERKSDRVGLPIVERAEVIAVTENLQIEYPNVMAGAPGRFRDEFESQRFEPEVNLRIHQRAGMDKEDSRGRLLWRHGV